MRQQKLTLDLRLYFNFLLAFKTTFLMLRGFHMKTATRNKTAQEIFDEITAHINGSHYSATNWYAGISQDAKQRLFNDHNVSEKGGYCDLP